MDLNKPPAMTAPGDTRTKKHNAGNAAQLSRQRIIWLLQILTRPTIKIALRHQVLIPECQRLVRWQGAKTALTDPEFAVPSQTHDGPSAAHAAVLTGLNRRELAAAAKDEHAPIEADGGELHRLIRIVTAWSTEPEYLDETGQPTDLPLSGPPPSLHSLNRRFGRCVPDRALADWLVTHGNAEWISSPEEQRLGKALRWTSPVLQPCAFTEDDLLVLGQMASDFLYSFQQALNPRSDEQPRLRETFYADIAIEHIDTALRALKEQQQMFNEDCDAILSKFRKPESSKTARIGVGSYSFCDAPTVLITDDNKNNKGTNANNNQNHLDREQL